MTKTNSSDIFSLGSSGSYLTISTVSSKALAM